MIEIRNLLSQPLTFQLAGEEQGLHLSSRQRKQIEDAQVSEEMRTAAKAGFVILTELEQPEQPEAQPAATELPDNPTDNIGETNGEPGTDESARAATPAAEDGGSSAEPESTEQPEETTDEPRSRKRR